MLGIKIGALERVKNKFEKLSFWTFVYFCQIASVFVKKQQICSKFIQNWKKKFLFALKASAVILLHFLYVFWEKKFWNLVCLFEGLKMLKSALQKHFFRKLGQNCSKWPYFDSILNMVLLLFSTFFCYQKILWKL